MRRKLFKAFYNGTWYKPVLIGGTLVPQVFSGNSELVNLCAHTEEYYVCEYVENDGIETIIDIYGNPELTRNV